MMHMQQGLENPLTDLSLLFHIISCLLLLAWLRMLTATCVFGKGLLWFYRVFL